MGAVNSAKSGGDNNCNARWSRPVHKCTRYLSLAWSSDLPKLWGKVDGVLCQSTWCQWHMMSAQIIIYYPPHFLGLCTCVYFSGSPKPLRISDIICRSSLTALQITKSLDMPYLHWLVPAQMMSYGLMALHGSIVRYRRQTRNSQDCAWERGGTYHQREWVRHLFVLAEPQTDCQ